MGAEPWIYFVPYEADIQAALDKLRDREFGAGRFGRSELQPATIEEAMINAGEEGTGSILDMMSIAAEPDFFAVAPLPDDELLRLYQTAKPTHAMIQRNMDFYSDIDRGQGIYIVTYENDEPAEIIFAGYSVDAMVPESIRPQETRLDSSVPPQDLDHQENEQEETEVTEDEIKNSPSVSSVSSCSNPSSSPVPAVSTEYQSDFSWPSCFFGTEQKVRSALRRLAQKASKDGTWKSVFAKLEGTFIPDCDQELFIGKLVHEKYFYPGPAERWRFYDLGKSINENSWGTIEERAQRSDRHNSLLIEGLEHLWFALGMLGSDCEARPSQFGSRHIEEVYLDYFERLVSWLPEFEKLENQLISQTVLFRRGFDEQRREQARLECTTEQFASLIKTHRLFEVPSWSRGVIGGAIGAGWRYSVDRLHDEFKGDVLAYLFADEIIQRADGRYRVTDTFRNLNPSTDSKRRER